MTGYRPPLIYRFGHFLCLLLPLMLLASACASVDVVQFSSDTFPSKSSGTAVKILDEKPSQPHIRLAQINIADSKKKNAALQRKIRDKAAELGADAILFSDPEHYYDTSVRYAPVYQSWGYYSPYSGWYGGSYARGVPTKHKTRRNSLSAVAIKFTNSSM